MKTKHRRELKENEVAQMINATREFTQEHGQRMTNAVVALVVVAGVIFAFMAYRNRQQSQGQDLLAQAMVVLNTAVVPVTATSNPGDAPAAASIGAKGTFSTEAQRLNAAVPKLKVAADAYPDTQAGIQARYHLATSLAALGQQKDAILMQLGRAYQAKGNTDEARKTFTDIVDNHPDSPYVGDARKELESLKG